MPAVSWLARHDSNRAVREAAQECLPFLLVRAEEERRATQSAKAQEQQERVRQSLLRAADTLIVPDTLLRPAATTPQTEACELLRVPE